MMSPHDAIKRNQARTLLPIPPTASEGGGSMTAAAASAASVAAAAGASGGAAVPPKPPQRGAPSSSGAGGVVRPIGPGLSLGIGGRSGLASLPPRDKRRVARLIEELLRVGAEHEVCSFERCRR